MVSDKTELTADAAHDHHHHDHDHDHSHDHHHHDHGHANVNFAALLFGGIFVLNSFLASIFYQDKPFLTTISAVLGALILALPIITAAIRDLLNNRIHMDVLVGLALVAAIAMGAYQEAGIIAFLMLIAITIEEKTAHGAQKSIHDIVRMSPSVARLLVDGDEKEVAVKELKVGDIVRVRPGENFPADGKVKKGMSTVNQALVTGESLPEDKGENDDVYAGTENLTGMVEIEVTGIGEDTTLGNVKSLIEEAEQTRLPILRMVDEYIVYYTPAILMIALITWFVTGDLMRFVYVMVIACPCAVVIATPSAVVAAIASAARLGMLIKNVAHIEIAAKIRAVVFDKTGTLTEGKLEVALLRPAENVELADLLYIAASTESQSNHPAAHAMQRLAQEADVTLFEASDYQEVAGKGVVAEYDGTTYRVGRSSWLKEEGLDVSAVQKDYENEEESSGLSVVFVSRNDDVIGWIGMRDAVRKEAEIAIKELNDLGVTQCAMVTGDNESVATAVAAKIGIKDIEAGCFPKDKVKYVQELKDKGYSVAVVGDGVNDAPALASGNIGIAMGAIGSDVAINSASIALMNNDLRRIPFLIELSRKTRSVININLLISCLMIVGGIMLFIFGDSLLNYWAMTFGFENPNILKSILASVVHIVGTLLVVFNSARLVRFGEHLQNPE